MSGFESFIVHAYSPMLVCTACTHVYVNPCPREAPVLSLPSPTGLSAAIRRLVAAGGGWLTAGCSWLTVGSEAPFAGSALVAALSARICFPLRSRLPESHPPKAFPMRLRSAPPSLLRVSVDNERYEVKQRFEQYPVVK